jgi:dTDP-4-amino-4,6-dideoxygalactose transaminase
MMTTKIPFLSFDEMHSIVKQEIISEFNDVYDSNWFILGEKVKLFESKYADYCNTKYSLGVGNGLDAIIIALMALGIKKGDEVIVPSNTYIATWIAITRLNAIPVPVEPKIDTYNIDPNLIEEKITNKTKAIIIVHLYGQICEMDKIIEIKNKYNLFLIEDNAQGQGTTFNGEISGSFGDINATSFYPGKNLGSLGDGGAITTNNFDYYEKSKLLRNYGSNKKYYNQVIGMNSRLDEMQAAFLNVKLKYLDQWNLERNMIAKKYEKKLKSNNNLILPKIAENCSSNYHLFVLRIKNRNELQNHLLKQGIETLIHYPIPPHLQEAYKYLGLKKNDYPIANEIAETCLSLPMFPGLDSSSIEYICDTINKFYNID